MSPLFVALATWFGSLPAAWRDSCLLVHSEDSSSGSGTARNASTGSPHKVSGWTLTSSDSDIRVSMVSRRNAAICMFESAGTWASAASRRRSLHRTASLNINCTNYNLVKLQYVYMSNIVLNFLGKWHTHETGDIIPRIEFHFSLHRNHK